MRFEGVDWIHLAQGRDRRCYEHCIEPLGSIGCGEFID